MARSSARKTELQPWVTLKAGPVKFQSEAMRVAMMLPMLLVYEVAVLTSETYASSVLCSAVSVSWLGLGLGLGLRVGVRARVRVRDKG